MKQVVYWIASIGMGGSQSGDGNSSEEGEASDDLLATDLVQSGYEEDAMAE